MTSQRQGFVRWAGIAGLMGALTLAGCSTKGAMSTTSSTEPAPAVTAMTPGGASGGGAGKTAQGQEGQVRGKAEGGTQEGSAQSGKSSNAPEGSPGQSLTGFSKIPSEEPVTTPVPMTVAKADQQEINTRRAHESARREVGDIYFAFDKWALSGEGKKNLLSGAESLKQDPTAPILIEGYCDERGSREYNLVLGDKRAKETRRYLLALGIKNPVKTISYGKERQVCTEHDESCYWKNRRAHLFVEEGK